MDLLAIELSQNCCDYLQETFTRSGPCFLIDGEEP